ncbi:MAG TPA: DUF6531 domain-containing protein, partial [Steroidobacteraceae bacterium]
VSSHSGAASPGSGQTTVTDPVTASSGNNYLAEVDYAGRGNSPLQFVRSYNSMDATFLKQNSNSTPELGTTLMGDGWSATYFQSLSSSSVTDVMSPWGR